MGASEALFCKQTGWKRPFPETICQEWTFLARASIFHFDLYDSDFLMYHESRRGNDLTDTSEWFIRPKGGWEWYRGIILRPQGPPPCEPDGEGWYDWAWGADESVEYPPNRSGGPVGWAGGVTPVFRGTLEDSWELYRTTGADSEEERRALREWMPEWRAEHRRRYAAATAEVSYDTP